MKSRLTFFGPVERTCLKILFPLGTLSLSKRWMLVPLLGTSLVFGGAVAASASTKAISVTISPTATSLCPFAKQQFVAAVTGTTNSAVVWSLSPAAGTISSAGLYTAPGTISTQQSVTVTATSVANTSKYARATITLLPPLAITTASLPSATASTQYGATITAMGGKTPYAWSLLSGTLPPGLSLASSGAISGIPTTAGSYSLGVRVQDALGNVASASYVITVAKATGVTTFYVSGQYGNDSWSGLLPSVNSTATDGPFKTLARAQAAMRASSTVKAATIRGGSYSLGSGWSLDWQDDGELWISYPGETVVLDGGGTGGINLTGVSPISFKGLTFQNMGPGGIYMHGGSSSITIRWNNFFNCNQTCISGGGVTSSLIDSNIINGQSPGNPSGTTGYAYSAIMLWYGSSDNRITHNLIENCQGGGIDFSAGATDQPNNNNVIDRNILQGVNTNVVDNGAIYMVDRSHSAVGNQITNNLVNGNGGTSYLTNWTKAFYLDDLTSNVLVSGNICRNCGEYAWQIHAGDHNTIVNNIFDLSSNGTLAGLYQNNTSLTDHGMLGNLVERNLLYFGNAVPGSLYQVGIGSTDALPMDANELYYSALNASIPNGKTILDLSPIYANPEFSNPSAANYSMPSTSPAYTWVNFLPLPTDLGPVPYAP